MVNRRHEGRNPCPTPWIPFKSSLPALDVGFGEVLHAALASLWRRKLLVGTIVAAAVALGIIAVFVIPPSYTSEADIRGGFVFSNAVAKNADTKSGPFIALDLMRVIETQKSLLQSHDLALRVVRQLGLEQLRSEVSERHWLPDKFYGSAANIQKTRPIGLPRCC